MTSSTPKVGTTYEEILHLVQGLAAAGSDDDRNIKWCGGGGPIGVARSPRGRIEIFLEGPPLRTRSSVIRENLEHQQWYRHAGIPLMANRLLLPSAGHFEQVASFLCTELLRNGAAADLDGAFTRTEAVIELAIERLRLADRAVLGLCGEMLVLRALIDTVGDPSVRAITESWKGHLDVARDFQIGLTGIEVKTTTGQTSSHHVQGVHQVEAGHAVGGGEETEFFLVSLGLQWTDPTESNSTSLPNLVEHIASRLRSCLGASAAPTIDDLLGRIASYGSPAEDGYDHRTMSEVDAFTRRFRMAFARCYDMTDDMIKVIRSDDLRARPFIDGSSLRFRLNLPDQITGDLNPVVGLTRAAQRMLRTSSYD